MSPLDQDIAALQKHAADPRVIVSQLVREALAAATRIKDDEMVQWLRLEMNGYGVMRDAPAYRWTRGQVRIINLYRGWIPVIFEDPAVEERVSRVATTQGIGEIEALLAQDSSRGEFGVQFPPEIARQITKGEPYMTNPMVHVARGSLERVLDHVRNRIFEWSLRGGAALNAVKPTGGEAIKQTRVVIQGSVIDSQIQIENSKSTIAVIDQPVDIGEVLNASLALREAIPKLGVGAEAVAQLEADLTALESQARSPKPRHEVLRTLAKGVGDVLMSVGGRVGAELAKRFLGL